MKYVVIFLMLCGAVCGQVNYYTGTNSLIDTGFSNATANFSVTGWAKLTTGDIIANQYDNIIFLSIDGIRSSFNSWGVYLSNRRISEDDYGIWKFWVISGSTTYIATNNALTEVGRLYYVAGVYDKTNVNLYIDGVLVDQTACNANANIKPVYIGSIPSKNTYNGAYWTFCGDLTDVRYYTRILTAHEIAEMYKNPVALSDDASLLLRTSITTNNTGTELTGTARNYGTGADVTYDMNPTVAPRKIRIRKPMGMELP